MKRFAHLSAPYIIWSIVLLLIPMILIVFYAITDSGNELVSFTLTLKNFIRFFTDADFLLILVRSLRIALETTILCVLLGYPVAYFISGRPDNVRNLLVLLITLPTWINMLVRTYAWVGLLSEDGIIYKIFNFLGLADGDLLYTEGAVLLGMVYNLIPFMILQINTSLCKMDPSLIEAAQDLGANGAQTFLRVVLPMSLPGVISGINLVFLPAASSFFIPRLLGGGSFFLIGNVIENQFITVGEWNFGSAISCIMAAVMMVTIYLVRRIESINASSGDKDQN